MSSYNLKEFRQIVSKIVKEEVEKSEQCKDCPGCDKCDPEMVKEEGSKKYTLKQLRSEISEAIREHYGMGDEDDMVRPMLGKNKFKSFEQEDDTKPWNSDFGECEFCGKQFLHPGEQEEHKSECSIDNYGYGKVPRTDEPSELKFESDEMCDEDEMCEDDDFEKKDEKPLKESFDFKAFITDFRDSTKKSIL